MTARSEALGGTTKALTATAGAAAAGAAAEELEDELDALTAGSAGATEHLPGARVLPEPRVTQLIGKQDLELPAAAAAESVNAIRQRFEEVTTTQVEPRERGVLGERIEQWRHLADRQDACAVRVGCRGGVGGDTYVHMLLACTRAR